MPHLVATYVYVLAGKQLQDLLEDSLQEGEGPLIALHRWENTKDLTVFTFSLASPIALALETAYHLQRLRCWCLPVQCLSTEPTERASSAVIQARLHQRDTMHGRC